MKEAFNRFRTIKTMIYVKEFFLFNASFLRNRQKMKSSFFKLIYILNRFAAIYSSWILDTKWWYFSIIKFFILRHHLIDIWFFKIQVEKTWILHQMSPLQYVIYNFILKRNWFLYQNKRFVCTREQSNSKIAIWKKC